MDIGIVGGGINGLCCAWRLAQQGHQVHVYERDTIMNSTSRSSSKLLHGGLRYLENREFRLVREALRERDGWIKRAPHLAKPLRLVMPIYKNSRRPQWLISFGLFLYDQLAGSSILPKAKRISSRELLSRDPSLNSDGLLCGYEFSDGQMDDHALGLWVAEQAKQAGATIVEKTEVTALNNDGSITIQSEHRCSHDRVINIAGPWAEQLLQRSEIESPLKLDPVRGSHLILDAPCSQAYLLEVPDERRIFFSLPWQGKTLVGTTEVRQDLGDSIACSSEEKSYLMGAWKHYFPSSTARIVETFSGVRPLLRSSRDPGKATREYAIHRTDKLITVLGGKWTTALALANKVTQAIY